jgi:hypothetical protein
MFLFQANRAEFAPVLAVLEFTFELPIAIPRACDGERDAEFRKDSGKPAAEAVEMAQRARVKIVGEAEIVARGAVAGRSAVGRLCLRPFMATTDTGVCGRFSSVLFGLGPEDQNAGVLLLILACIADPGSWAARFSWRQENSVLQKSVAKHLCTARYRPIRLRAL